MSPEPEFQTKRMNRKLNLSLDITSSSVNIKTRNRKVLRSLEVMSSRMLNDSGIE
jgi:hypothetical protein